MPVSTAAKLGTSATGWSSSPTATSRLLIPAVRDSSVDQAKPMITSERSEEHTSELQSLMRISYAVFCLKKKNNKKNRHRHWQIPHPHKSYKPDLPAYNHCDTLQ